MSVFEVILIGIALSMDAFAVCLSCGMVYKELNRKKKIQLPIAFGAFQGLMPLAGYFLGSLFANIINRFSGPVVLIILGVIGINMIREGISPEQNVQQKTLTFKILIIQAIATSIDAFAVGVSLAAGRVNIFTSSAIIAVTTFVISGIGILIGEKVGEWLGERAEILGGVILIIIGLKTMFF